MTESNPSTRKFPREMTRPNLSIEGPYKSTKTVTVSQEFSFWFCIVMAFAAGFLTHLLWGAK